MLYNVGSHSEGCKALRCQPDGVVVLVELVQGYRDKQYHATLLWDALAVLGRMIHAAAPEWLQMVSLLLVCCAHCPVDLSLAAHRRPKNILSA